jgi:cytochrome c oxidase assembly factor CtaG
MSLHLEITQGLRVDDLASLQDKVRLRGGRLIAYSEVISAIMISARSYTVKWVASPEMRISAGIPSMIVTALLGWWAILGPYRSVTALIWNRRGGVDITDALLRAHAGNSSLLGYSDTVALGAFQESASRLSRRICGGALALLAVAFACLIWSFSKK